MTRNLHRSFPRALSTTYVDIPIVVRGGFRYMSTMVTFVRLGCDSAGYLVHDLIIPNLESFCTNQSQ